MAYERREEGGFHEKEREEASKVVGYGKDGGDVFCRGDRKVISGGWGGEEGL